MKYKIIFGILVLLFLGCEKKSNPCETAKQGENYVLSDSAKTLISNYIDADRIIFKTNAGNEVYFNVLKKDELFSYQVGLPCEVDTSQNQISNGTSQVISYSLINNAVISELLQIGLYKFPDISIQKEESLVITLGESFSNTFGNGDELFYYIINSDNSHLNYLDSLTISGKTFYSVYEMSDNTARNLEIKYTFDQGVVYIKDPSNTIEYVYERKE
jgi:hypothetical protein